MTDESIVPPTGSNPGVDPNAPRGPLPYVDKLVGILGQFNIAFPIAFEATRLIVGLFRDSRRENLPSDAEVIAHLRSRAMEDREANEAWLRERGYLPTEPEPAPPTE